MFIRVSEIVNNHTCRVCIRLTCVSRMELRIFRNNFGDIAALVDEFNSFDDSIKIKLPKIVVAGEWGDVGRVIRDLTGFALWEKHIEYHYKFDPKCKENEAFCTVNDSVMEINMSSQYAKMVDNVNELIDWFEDGSNPIVLNIRANYVAEFEIVHMFRY